MDNTSDHINSNQTNSPHKDGLSAEKEENKTGVDAKIVSIVISHDVPRPESAEIAMRQESVKPQANGETDNLLESIHKLAYRSIDTDGNIGMDMLEVWPGFNDSAFDNKVVGDNKSPITTPIKASTTLDPSRNIDANPESKPVDDHEDKSDTDGPTHPTRLSTVPPSDVRQLTIKNLDTGEEFVIGENDPDFDFDTFELGKGPHYENVDLGVENEGNGPKDTNPAPTDQNQSETRRLSWWDNLILYLFSNQRKYSKESEQNPRMSRKSSISKNDGNQSSKESKTPFTKLSSFKFRKELGKGAFGRVLLAEAKTDGQLYALKIISKRNMRSSDKRQAKAERDILLAMGHIAPHPFTAGLRFAFQSENNLYLGMDFLPGGNLKELIKRHGSLPEDWVRLFAAELTLAISHLHSLNVIYRDIKPHNVMVDGRGHVVLIDFGLSKQDISSPRGALSLVGTPDYSAPEVLKTGVYQIEQSNRNKEKNSAKNKKKYVNTMSPAQTAIVEANHSDIPPHIGYGRAADWWSLGIMIYEMLCGTPTFRGSDLRQTYQKVLYADVEFRPTEKFSTPARLLLLGLLKKDPSERLGSWYNPPHDIKEHSFFHDINWEKVYHREYDGPWIPPPVVFGRRHSQSISTSTPKKIDSSRVNERDINRPEVSSSPKCQPIMMNSQLPSQSMQQDEGFSSRPVSQSNAVPIGSFVNSNINNPHESGNPNGQTNRKMSIARNELMHDSDSDRDTFSERPSELIHLRESIIASSKINQANRIADWSFFDENILVSASNETSPMTNKK